MSTSAAPGNGATGPDSCEVRCRAALPARTVLDPVGMGDSRRQRQNVGSQYNEIGREGSRQADLEIEIAACPARNRTAKHALHTCLARPTAGVTRREPLSEAAGLTSETLDDVGTVVLRCPHGPSIERAPGTGQYHGGVIASLIALGHGCYSTKQG